MQMESDPIEQNASNDISKPTEAQRKPESPRESFSWSKLLAIFGVPCLIAVAAIDPGNLEVDLQAGSTLGYALLWVVLLSSFIGWLLQTLAAHTTICSGYHLAELYARAYRHDKLLYYSIFTISELSVIAFDVAEVVGTAFALQLLFGLPLWFGMLLSALDTMLVLFLQRSGMNKVEIIIEGLLLILSACLFYEFALSRPAFPDILKGSVVPSLGSNPKEGAILAVGLLGSVIMSHNLFLHSWLLKERMYNSEGNSTDNDGAIGLGNMAAMCRYATIEVAVIFIATFFINACVLSVSASLPTKMVPDDIGLKDAGALLQRFLGTELAAKAWAVALLCSGHAATVTGTMASQAICEGFLDVREGRSPAFVILATRALAIIPALLAALYAGTSGSDRLIVMSQVVLSLAVPFALIPMFKIFSYIRRTTPSTPSDSKLMGAGYLAFGLLLVANFYVLVQIVEDVHEDHRDIASKVVWGVCIASVALIWKLVFTPMHLSSLSDNDEALCELEEGQALMVDSKPLYGPDSKTLCG